MLATFRTFQTFQTPQKKCALLSKPHFFALFCQVVFVKAPGRIIIHCKSSITHLSVLASCVARVGHENRVRGSARVLTLAMSSHQTGRRDSIKHRVSSQQQRRRCVFTSHTQRFFIRAPFFFFFFRSRPREKRKEKEKEKERKNSRHASDAWRWLLFVPSSFSQTCLTPVFCFYDHLRFVTRPPQGCRANAPTRREARPHEPRQVIGSRRKRGRGSRRRRGWWRRVAGREQPRRGGRCDVRVLECRR